jgi:drug/metabolite transporter (DMT)-like permease
MPSSQRSIIMLLITMVIWGSTFVVTKEVIADFPPFTLAFARVAAGTLVLLVYMACRRQRPAGSARLPWRYVSLMGFVGVALYYVAFNLSLVYTSASQGALVQSFIPAMVALVAVLWLRERASAARWLGIGLSVIGVLILVSGSGTSSARAPAPLPGNVLMFVSVVCWGTYTSMAKRVTHLDAAALTTGVMGTGALMLLPLAIAEIAQVGLPHPTAQGWLGVAFLGVGASGLAYLFYNAALRHVDASHAAVYTNLIPIVGVITGIVVLGEPISIRALIGGAIVLSGVWLTGRTSPSAASA